MKQLLGIHHVTAICADAQANIDFYAGSLGLRLVKLTVNFDDPTAYHLYYGDSKGTPGTIVTFFAYNGRCGTVGDGSFTRMSLAIPPGSTSFWERRLEAHLVGEGRLRFRDPDGIELELTEAAGPVGADPHVTPDIGPSLAIRGVDRVTLATKRTNTMTFLTSYLEFKEIDSTEDGDVLGVGEGESGALLEVTGASDRAQGGPGTIHHVAWRVEDDLTQQGWLEYLMESGVGVSPIKDRDYFRSIYFREPGGALLEIATDGPGFAVDEPATDLGARLMLPKQHEHLRDEIERRLPRLVLPGGPR